MTTLAILALATVAITATVLAAREYRRRVALAGALASAIAQATEHGEARAAAEREARLVKLDLELAEEVIRDEGPELAGRYLRARMRDPARHSARAPVPHLPTAPAADDRGGRR